LGTINRAEETHMERLLIAAAPIATTVVPPRREEILGRC
jgi:hypothetical protein